MKTCTKCNEVKALTKFHRDKSRKDGYRNICKPCVVLYMQDYYVVNKDKVVARATEWNEVNRTRHNKKCSDWVKRNRGAVNARTARRYAAKTKATPAWAAPGTEHHWLINEIYSLASLRSKLTSVQWEVDHKYPLRGTEVSGLHVPDNLQVVLMTENRRKSNRVQVT
jgi:hypothetical protein